MARKAFFWIHLAAGIAAAVPLAVMAATGVLLAFEPRILAAAEAPRPASSPASGQRPSLDALVGSVAGERGEGAVSVRMRAGAGQPVEVRRGRSAFVLLDPGSGEVVGRSSSLRGVFGFVERVHRWLGSRELGAGVTGVSTLLALLLSASGLVLWWPRSAAALRGVVWPRRGLSGRARDWQWHNAVGVLTLPLLFVLSATGTFMAWPWAQTALYAAVGVEAPRREGPPGGSGGPGAWNGRSRPQARAHWQAWSDTILSRAPRGWETVSIAAPDGRGKGAQGVFRAGGDRGAVLGTVQLDEEGGFTSWKPARSDPGSSLKRWIRATHTGEILGLPGQILVALGSLGTLLLVWTGTALSWRRYGRFRARRS